ncbi:four-helix bundle copper-binding protein [Eoetvoesiella caeni]|uniref:four-helix bundle copper-binding protein n=1 Tax=Eoetvoesiella caeni TaxID=645616 RepID=UPI0032119C94
MARCIKLDMDCAQSCRLAASYMAGGSEFTQTMCQVCADICETCSHECATHQRDHCQRCAQACRKCAEVCGQMA